ncbi:MAG: hypothetical protein QME32_01485 [Endomicrobiia bacterium]|nr:hypothetical protein [Endomicrobiia bacterium]
MKETAAIILRRDFLEAALAPFGETRRVYSGNETKNLFETIRSRLRGDEPYPTKYLFGRPRGAEKQRGVLEIYFEVAREVEICADDDASVRLSSQNQRPCIYDLQFSDATSRAVIAALSHGDDVAGWTHPALNSKSFQMLALALKQKTSLLPASAIIPPAARGSPAATLDALCGFFTSDYLILKSSAGAASRLTPTLGYAVFPRDNLGLWLFDLADTVAKERGQDIILSEMLVTDDPFSDGAENVVHKLNCCGFSVLARDARPSVLSAGWCKKIVCGLDFARVSKNHPTKLGELITANYWTDAEISHIGGLNELLAAFDFTAACGCALTMDFMIPPDGKPRFLETNKFSATLADIPARGGVSALDIYAESNASLSFPPENTDRKILALKNIEEFYATAFEKFYAKPGIIFISSEKGVEFVNA